MGRIGKEKRKGVGKWDKLEKREVKNEEKWRYSKNGKRGKEIWRSGNFY